MLTKPVNLTQHVIDCIEDEFVYHATLSAQGRADTEDHGISGQLTTLRCYANDADVAWTKKSSQAALDALRKVAGIALRALVLYGCPRRDWSPEALEALKGLDPDVLVAYYDRVRRLTEVQGTGCETPVGTYKVGDLEEALDNYERATQRLAEANWHGLPIGTTIDRTNWEAHNAWTAAATRAIYKSAKRPKVFNVQNWLAETRDKYEGVKRRVTEAQHDRHCRVDPIDASIGAYDWATRNAWTAAATADIYASANRSKVNDIGEVTIVGAQVDPKAFANSIRRELKRQESNRGTETIPGWEEVAAQESRNRDYYRSLIVEIGELFGEAAYIADDGGRHEDVLCAKVPELVREALAKSDAIREGDLVCLKSDENNRYKMVVGRITDDGVICHWWLNSTVQTHGFPVAALAKVT